MFLIVTRLLMMERLIDKYDVTSEFVNTLPRDIKLLSLAEQAEKAAGAVDDDSLDGPLRHADLQIPHAPQTAAVAEVDDLLAPQFTIFHLHFSQPELIRF